MAKIKIKLNRREVRRLLRGDGEYSGVREDLERRGRAVAEQAGEGMEVDSSVSKNRARVSVRTATPEAVRREHETRYLSKALDAAKD